MAATPPDAGKGDAKAAEAVVSTAASFDSRYRELIDKLRGRVDATGKTLGGLGTTAATAVGLAKIGDLFPVENETGQIVWFAAAIAGFLAVGISVLYVAGRLTRVARPVVMRTDIDDMERTGELEPGERPAVDAVFSRWAQLNGVESLAAYELQSVRIRRSSRWTSDKDERARREQLADEIDSDIRAAFGLAALRVTRSRAAEAVTGRGARNAYLAFVLGVVLFALGTDYVSSERTERVAIAKSCADARKAGAKGGELPSVCERPDKEKDKAEQKPSARQQQTALAAKLVEALRECESAVKSGPLTDDACLPTREAVRRALR